MRDKSATLRRRGKWLKRRVARCRQRACLRSCDERSVCRWAARGVAITGKMPVPDSQPLRIHQPDQRREGGGAEVEFAAVDFVERVLGRVMAVEVALRAGRADGF